MAAVYMRVCVCAGSEHTGGQQGCQQQAAPPVGYGGHDPAGLERGHVNTHKPRPLGKPSTCSRTGIACRQDIMRAMKAVRSP